MATLDALTSQPLPTSSLSPSDASLPATSLSAAPASYWIGGVVPTRSSWENNNSQNVYAADALNLDPNSAPNMSPGLYDMNPFPPSLHHQHRHQHHMAHPMLAAPGDSTTQSSQSQPQPSLTSTTDPYAPVSSIQPPLPMSNTTTTPPSPLAYRPWPSYSLPAMNGPVLTNIHNPNGQLSLVGNVPNPATSLLPGLTSGRLASMQHQIYAAGPMSGGGGALPAGTNSSGPLSHDRPFRCDQCSQSFNRNHDLKRHKRIHLSVKPFPCTNCDKSFSRKDALKRHRLVKGCGRDLSDSVKRENE